MERNEIYKAFGLDYTDMTRRLLERSGLCDELSPEMCIGIKPNLVTSTPAKFGGTTHPEIVEGIIIYLQSHGFNNIIITEGSWVGDTTSDAFEYCGYNELSKKYNVPLVDTQLDGYFEKTARA